MSLSEAEFVTLRRTIATRGTVRIILFPVTMLGWASLALIVIMFSQAPVAVLFPLAVLVGGFEAIHALHVGVERIGRYLQVYYENAETGPRWETTVMAVGPALPGGGIDPLFSTVFACAFIREHHSGVKYVRHPRRDAADRPDANGAGRRRRAAPGLRHPRGPRPRRRCPPASRGTGNLQGDPLPNPKLQVAQRKSRSVNRLAWSARDAGK